MADSKKAREPVKDGVKDEVPSFEAALQNLELVVVRLEKGELSLEESLTAYEDGVRLVHAARSRLDGMQSRLEQLLHDGKTAPLVPSSSSSSSAASSSSSAASSSSGKTERAPRSRADEIESTE